jgi:hypothetical protein
VYTPALVHSHRCTASADPYSRASLAVASFTMVGRRTLDPDRSLGLRCDVTRNGKAELLVWRSQNEAVGLGRGRRRQPSTCSRSTRWCWRWWPGGVPSSPARRQGAGARQVGVGVVRNGIWGGKEKMKWHMVGPTSWEGVDGEFPST